MSITRERRVENKFSAVRVSKASSSSSSPELTESLCSKVAFLGLELLQKKKHIEIWAISGKKNWFQIKFFCILVTTLFTSSVHLSSPVFSVKNYYYKVNSYDFLLLHYFLMLIQIITNISAYLNLCIWKASLLESSVSLSLPNELWRCNVANGDSSSEPSRSLNNELQSEHNFNTTYNPTCLEHPLHSSSSAKFAARSVGHCAGGACRFTRLQTTSPWCHITTTFNSNWNNKFPWWFSNWFSCRNGGFSVRFLCWLSW